MLVDPTDEASASAPICTKCRTVERENSNTKSKLDQLRLVMQQKKERREARKLQTAPYLPMPGTAAARLLAAATAAAQAAQLANAQSASTSSTSAADAAPSATAAGADANSPNTGAANNGIIAEVPTTINNLVEEVDTAA